MSSLEPYRKLLWHFRRGGIKQVRLWQKQVAVDGDNRSINSVRGAEGAWVGRRKRKHLSFQRANLENLNVRLPSVRVGVVLDPFSAVAFGAEWDCLQLSAKGWKNQLATNDIELLFVESAWSGADGTWAGQIAGVEHTGSVLSDLVTWCKDHDIPTVFWNKEDPIHYQDYISAARLFDQVFTTDETKVVDYLSDMQHDRVGILPFAAQPRIHNPTRPAHGWHARDIAFAGMYFTDKYPERSQQMDELLSGAISASSKLDGGLEIFSRQLGGLPKYQFPEKFSPYVVGSLDYAQMLTAYKAYKVFLNVNTVIDSPSMCSRRIFEILASGASVVTSPSRAISNFFSSNEIFVSEDELETSELLLALVRNPSLGQRYVHRAQRRIWANHTYAHRARTVLASVLPALVECSERPTVSVLVSTNRRHRIGDVFRTVGSQLNVDIQLVLLTHGFTLTTDELRTLKADHGVANLQYLEADASLPLGACLNKCVEIATGMILSKMDDDDYYAPEYMSDLLYALEYSGADIVGKQAHYMYVESIDGTLVRFPEKEHQWTRTVMGPTITAYSHVFKTCPFPELERGEDTEFLRLASEHGFRIYSSDRYNYCQRRVGDNHTWKVSDMKLVAGSEIAFYGNFEKNISI